MLCSKYREEKYHYQLRVVYWEMGIHLEGPDPPSHVALLTFCFLQIFTKHHSRVPGREDLQFRRCNTGVVQCLFHQYTLPVFVSVTGKSQTVIRRLQTVSHTLLLPRQSLAICLCSSLAQPSSGWLIYMFWLALIFPSYMILHLFPFVVAKWPCLSLTLHSAMFLVLLLLKLCFKHVAQLIEN